VSEALDAAQRIGLYGLVARIERLTTRLPAPSADDLSPREVDVLRVVARGLSNREAAAVLHLSERTLANDLRSIMRKTGCENRAQATDYALRHEIAET
jgi:DNA-binding NarL/FixJ family response regulator